jgi:hypothetical protein
MSVEKAAVHAGHVVLVDADENSLLGFGNLIGI